MLRPIPSGIPVQACSWFPLYRIESDLKKYYILAEGQDQLFQLGRVSFLVCWAPDLHQHVIARNYEPDQILVEHLNVRALLQSLFTTEFTERMTAGSLEMEATCLSWTTTLDFKFISGERFWKMYTFFLSCYFEKSS